MSQFLIAAVNSTAARFFTLDSTTLSEHQPGPDLVEQNGLSSTISEQSGEALWGDTKTGRNRGVGGQAHSYDDHRQNHLDEFDRKFAHSVATQLVGLAQSCQAQQVVLAAEPQVLGLMRSALTPLLPKQLEITEICRDLSRLRPHELHEYLAEKGQLPPRRRGTR